MQQVIFSAVLTTQENQKTQEAFTGFSVEFGEDDTG